MKLELKEAKKYKDREVQCGCLKGGRVLSSIQIFPLKLVGYSKRNGPRKTSTGEIHCSQFWKSPGAILDSPLFPKVYRYSCNNIKCPLFSCMNASSTFSHIRASCLGTI